MVIAVIVLFVVILCPLIVVFYMAEREEKAASIKKQSEVIEEAVYSIEEAVYSIIVDMGLSLIGRKIDKSENAFLTAEGEEKREDAEKNFLDTLRILYPDPEVYDILLKHFMLFKEAMLFIIFRSLVIHKPTYNAICNILTLKLSKGLSNADIREQRVYHSVFIKYCDDVFAQTKRLSDAIPCSFWYTAAEKYPNFFSRKGSLNIFLNYFLCDVFLYAFNTLEGILPETYKFKDACINLINM